MRHRGGRGRARGAGGSRCRSKPRRIRASAPRVQSSEPRKRRNVGYIQHSTFENALFRSCEKRARTNRATKVWACHERHAQERRVLCPPSLLSRYKFRAAFHLEKRAKRFIEPETVEHIARVPSALMLCLVPSIRWKIMVVVLAERADTEHFNFTHRFHPL